MIPGMGASADSPQQMENMSTWLIWSIANPLGARFLDTLVVGAVVVEIWILEAAWGLAMNRTKLSLWVSRDGFLTAGMILRYTTTIHRLKLKNLGLTYCPPLNVNEESIKFQDPLLNCHGGIISGLAY